MRAFPIAFALTASLAATAAFAQTPSPALRQAVAAPTRAEANRARDVYRHPAETLAFFGVKASDTVVEINEWKQCYLRANIDHETLQFSASPDGKTWQSIGGPLDMTKISDDYGSVLHFTGAFVGICAQDLGYASATADFDYFTLQPT